MKNAIVLLLGVLLCQAASAVSIGDVAPRFSLPRISNDDGTAGIPEGKVVLLDFWASWCGPCRISMPQFEKLREQFDPDEFSIVAVSVDKDEASAHRFLRRVPVNYEILIDTSGATAEQYALPGMPTSFVIDRNGRITKIHSGFRAGDLEDIEAHIRELLEQQE